MKSNFFYNLIKGVSVLLFSVLSLAYAADQTINLEAKLVTEGEAKICKITYIDASSKSNCDQSDSCTKDNECICATGGTHIQWKAKGEGQDKFKFQVTQLPAIFNDDNKCKLDKFKSTHNCKVKENPEPGKHKYDFVGKFKSDDKEYDCIYDPIIIIKSVETPENTSAQP
jgi:hypothetical protein